MSQSLEAIVQRMIDSGESEENIASVIQEHNRQNQAPMGPIDPENPDSGYLDYQDRPAEDAGMPPSPTIPQMGGRAPGMIPDVASSPSSFSEGVLNSLPDVQHASMMSGAGYLTGAIADVPKTIYDIGKSVVELPQNAYKLGKELERNPYEVMEQTGAGLGHIARQIPGAASDFAQRSGSEPFAFGRALGQITGQPITTGPMAHFARYPAMRGVGGAIEGAGGFVARNQPLTGVLPHFADVRTMRMAEGALGRGIESVGRKIKQWGTPTPVAPVPPIPPEYVESEVLPWGEFPETDVTHVGQPPINPNLMLPPGPEPPTPMDPQAPGGPFNYVRAQTPYIPPEPPVPTELQSRGIQFNLPEQTAQPGQNVNLMRQGGMSDAELIEGMQNPAQKVDPVTGQIGENIPPLRDPIEEMAGLEKPQVIIPVRDMSKATIERMTSEGYKLKGLTSDGQYVYKYVGKKNLMNPLDEGTANDTPFDPDNPEGYEWESGDEPPSDMDLFRKDTEDAEYSTDPNLEVQREPPREVNLGDSNIMRVDEAEQRMRWAFDRQHNTGSHYLNRQLARIRQLAPTVMRDATPDELAEFGELVDSVASDPNLPADVASGVRDIQNLYKQAVELRGNRRDTADDVVPFKPGKGKEKGRNLPYKMPPELAEESIKNLHLVRSYWESMLTDAQEKGDLARAKTYQEQLRNVDELIDKETKDMRGADVVPYKNQTEIDFDEFTERGPLEEKGKQLEERDKFLGDLTNRLRTKGGERLGEPGEFDSEWGGGEVTKAPMASVNKPREVREILDSLYPNTKSPELNDWINQLRKSEQIRKMSQTGGYTDEEFAKMSELVGKIRRHPDFPPELAEEWKRAGEISKKRGPKFNVGDTVQQKQWGSMPEDAWESPYGPEYGSDPEFPDMTDAEFENAPIMSFPNKTKGGKLGEIGESIKSPEGENVVDFKPKKNDPFDPGTANDDPNDPRHDMPMAMGYDPNTGEIVYDVNPTHAIKELTSGYSNALQGIMAREGLQNAFDAVKALGADGDVHISAIDANTYRKTPGKIIISDNGKGMSIEEIREFFTTLHSSGKLNDADATGGKGVGSATYVLGGDYFKLETVTKLPNGKKVRSSFEGKPEQLLRFKPTEENVPVPDSEPTGTTITTHLKDTQDAWDARQSIEKIIKYSRNKQTHFTYKIADGGIATSHDLMGNSRDKKVATDLPIDRLNDKADIYVPHDARVGNRQSIKVQVLNNGMWQFEKYFHLSEDTNGIPEVVVVDVKPQVPELHDDYPFPVQRESVKDNVWTEVEEAIKNTVVTPMAAGKKMDLVKLWDQMTQVSAPRGGTHRETVFFDAGDRLTPPELHEISQSQIIRQTQQQIDKFLHIILTKLGKSAEQQKLVRTGIYMIEVPSGRLYGHHIPNPGAPKAESAILVNIFNHLEDHPTSPGDAALAIVDTLLHEAAHIGTTAPPRVPFKISPKDLNDPRVGKFLQNYLNQVSEQGGVDWGHQTDFLRRLGEIYATTGTESAFEAADAFEAIFKGYDPKTAKGKLVGKGGKSGGYSSEISRLLHIYKESRGRPATTEDILTSTGVKQANPKRAGTGTISGSNKATRRGTTFGESIGEQFGESIEERGRLDEIGESIKKGRNK